MFWRLLLLPYSGDHNVQNNCGIHSILDYFAFIIKGSYFENASKVGTRQIHCIKLQTVTFNFWTHELSNGFIINHGYCQITQKSDFLCFSFFFLGKYWMLNNSVLAAPGKISKLEFFKVFLLSSRLRIWNLLHWRWHWDSGEVSKNVGSCPTVGGRT